jgi:3D (Asp-Asp-Asp) domain-containing protein
MISKRMEVNSMSHYQKKNHRKQNLIIWSFLAGIFFTGAFIGGLITALCCHTSTASVVPTKCVTVIEKDDTEPLVATERLAMTTGTTETDKPEYVAFTATAYCPCEKCCGKWANNRPNGKIIGAAGVELEPGVSIAADFSVLPIGTTVEIEGLGTYKVQDTGAAVTGNKIDIYFLNHDDAVEFGVQTVYLRVLEK